MIALQTKTVQQTKQLISLLGTPYSIAQYMCDSMASEAVSTEGAIRVYENGGWKHQSELSVHKFIASFDGQDYDNQKKNKRSYISISDATTRSYANMFNTVLGEDGFFDSDDSDPVVAFRNGVIHVNDSTVALKPHSADNRIKTEAILNNDYDPTAKCPLWLKTLDEIFEGDIDKAQKIQFLQEYFGAAIACVTTSYQRHPFLLGDKASNGKSVIINVFKNMFPEGSQSAVSPDALETTFGKVNLLTSMVNTCTEVSGKMVRNVNTLKMILVGDEIEIQKKNKDPIRVSVRCAHMYSSNDALRSNDSSNGLPRRFCQIPFNNLFLNKNDKNYDANNPRHFVADTDRLSKILGSESGALFNWAIEGLKRLIARGGYILPDSHEVEDKAFKMNSNTVYAFVDEMIDTKAENLVSKVECYNAYKDWTEECNLHAVGRPEFYSRMASLGVTEKRKDNKRHFSCSWKNQAELINSITKERN